MLSILVILLRKMYSSAKCFFINALEKNIPISSQVLMVIKCTKCNKVIFLIFESYFALWRHHCKYDYLQFPLVMIRNVYFEMLILRQAHVDTISLSKVCSNSIPPRFVWKWFKILDVRLKGCKYLKNDKWVESRNSTFSKHLFRWKYIESLKTWCL